MEIPKRGEIWVVQLDPAIGSEIKKTRPAIIMSNNINNEHSDTVTVIPITSSTQTIYPFEIVLHAGEGGLKYESKAKANQIRTIDKRRLVEVMGAISAEKISALEHALALHLDLNIGKM